ncbi:AdoMet_MTases domain containing protein [uncultured Caudovirales phage]|uniref:AdoMet_MTases domain containing protein n=1 Tax=uncultured Caudovirales phage TaxID=2100421 RepID=A0A6J5LCN9_9CAUD|nr:AdoMet_MTases domain containing protein [uncultured Caudovirales phage]
MTIYKNIADIKANPKNPRVIKGDKFAKLVKSITDFPEMLEKRPLVCFTDTDDKVVVLGGNMRLKAAKECGLKQLPIILADDWTEEQKSQFLIKDNVSFGEWNYEDLQADWDVEQLGDWGLDLPSFGSEDITEEKSESKEQNKKLSDRFIIPPFSVLDTKQGAWQQRKNYWLSLGIKSEIGRENNSLGLANVKNYDYEYRANYDISKGTSIFDPVLCELAYQWFNVPNGKILDPFAGGSVRGIVAAKLGFNYLGNDLRSEQIEANRINAKEVLRDAEIYPVWTCGDSLQIDTIAKDYKADLIFSCPPYSDLEVYSDIKEDISNMPYKEFIEVYKQIIKKSCDLLKEDRFAVFIVGDVRDKKGFYQNFVSDTIISFWNCGVILYNEMILVNQLGNLPMRAAKYFNGGRKVGKQHQNVLVFYKGNPKNIKTNYPELDLSYITENIQEDAIH